MCRQFLHRAPAPDARPADRDRPGPRIGRTTTALIATGLLTGLGTPPVAAQQTPDSWSAERRAQLPSGLAVQFDWAAAPGVGVEAAPGKLAERTTGGSAYTDGIRPGDPAETFRAVEDHPHADGSWRALGTLRLTFSRPVRNPRLHLSGLTGLATGGDGTTGTSTRLTVAAGTPAAPTLTGRTDWAGWTVGPTELAPAAEGFRDGDADGSGTLELTGTVSTVDLRVEQRSTARDGSTTPPAALRQAWTVTLDEGLGSAPQDYGNASHLLSDLFLGQDAAPAAPRSRPGLAQAVERPLLPGPAPAAAGPLAPGTEAAAGLRSPWANPAQPRPRPGRADYPGTDPSLSFPAEAVAGGSYRVEAPVSPGGGPAVLAGWIDFDHNGRFDREERAQADVPAGATRAALEWQVPAAATGGDTWVRLRLARDGSQLADADGFADSGQVVDQRIPLKISAATGPEIALPVPGSVTGELRPEFRGDDAVAGAGIAVQENGSAVCLAQVGGDGSWNCRPESALSEGAHTLVVTETTHGGVLHGPPFRVTVKTAAPTAPVLTLPDFSNDPGLLVTGLGEPGSTVTVSAADGAQDIDLCSTAVAADGSWSCLPVENLADGPHRLTPHARDAAGNRSDGKPVRLTVDTGSPDKPQLTSPAAGVLLPTARPVIGGRAEPGATVTVTAARANGERTTVCSAVAGADGSWSCTSGQDIPGGDVALVATATDPAGNGTASDPVPVRVPKAPAGGGAATASPSSTRPAPSTAPSATATPSVPASSTATPSAPAAATATAPAAQSPATTGPSASASASVPALLPSASPSAPASPEVPPEVVPVVIPAGSPAPTASPSPSAAAVPPAGVDGAVEGPQPPFLAQDSAVEQSVFAANLSMPQEPAAPVESSTTPPAGTPSTGAPSATPSATHAASDEQVGQPAAAAEESGRARALAAPPQGGMAAAERRAAATGWRGLACGALLIAAGFGLLARRVLGGRRRAGRRR
ncbi:Ig-like domain-containing protein [Kitasatospora sp. NPDC004531]